MRGYAAIQLENESFQRLFAGVTLSLIDETEQALLYREEDRKKIKRATRKTPGRKLSRRKSWCWNP